MKSRLLPYPDIWSGYYIYIALFAPLSERMCPNTVEICLYTYIFGSHAPRVRLGAPRVNGPAGLDIFGTLG